MADLLRKYESLLTLTPQRMRMIVHAIEETLDKGLQKDGQVVPMSKLQSMDLYTPKGIQTAHRTDILQSQPSSLA